MTTTELEELARALGGAPTGNDTEGLLRALLETAGADEAGVPGAVVGRLLTGALGTAESIVAGEASRLSSRDAGSPTSTGDSLAAEPVVAATLSALLRDGRGVGTPGTGGTEPARRLGADLAALLPLPAARVAAPVVSGTSASRSGGDSGGSMAASVLKTIGMATGVGPVVTGLMKLFGGGGSTEPAAYSPIPFSLPEQISVEAGLAADRTFVPVGYSAAGGVRSMGSPTAGRSGGAQAAPIQINVQAMDSKSFADHSDEIARAVREAMLRSHSLNDVISEI